MQRYRTSDALPEEATGFENWMQRQDEELSDEGEEEESNGMSRSQPYPSPTGEFNFEFFRWEQDDSPGLDQIYGKMTCAADGTIVAVLSADLVERFGDSIYGVCDDRSSELINLARFLVNDDGTLRKALKNVIKDPSRIAAAGSGGLLFLDEVHVLRARRGRDLSLDLTLELLRWLDGEWTLAVSHVVPWDHSDQERESAPRTDAERISLCRHFARLGFQQVGRNTSWFLESSRLPPAWLPRDAVAGANPLYVFLEHTPTPAPPLSDLDQKLRDLAIAAATVTDVEELTALLQQVSKALALIWYRALTWYRPPLEPPAHTVRAMESCRHTGRGSLAAR